MTSRAPSEYLPALVNARNDIHRKGNCGNAGAHILHSPARTLPSVRPRYYAQFCFGLVPITLCLVTLKRLPIPDRVGLRELVIGACMLLSPLWICASGSCNIREQTVRRNS